MDIDKTRKVRVRNRSNGGSGYKIDALRVTRSWSKPGDILYIPIDELIELTTIPGGQKLLDNNLVIEDTDAIEIIYGDNLPPEYFYGEDEIDFLLHKGTNEQLFDALDYAPKGVLNLIRAMAIKEMPDTTAKVDAINRKFNIKLETIIRNKEIAEEDNVEVESERRAEPVIVEKKEEKPSKYKVVSKK